MANRHIKIPPQCPTCNIGVENIKHLLFLVWQKAQEIWQNLGVYDVISEPCAVDLAGEAMLEYLLNIPKGNDLFQPTDYSRASAASQTRRVSLWAHAKLSPILILIPARPRSQLDHRPRGPSSPPISFVSHTCSFVSPTSSNKHRPQPPLIVDYMTLRLLPLVATPYHRVAGCCRTLVAANATTYHHDARRTRATTSTDAPCCDRRWSLDFARGMRMTGEPAMRDSSRVADVSCKQSCGCCELQAVRAWLPTCTRATSRPLLPSCHYCR